MYSVGTYLRDDLEQVIDGHVVAYYELSALPRGYTHTDNVQPCI